MAKNTNRVGIFTVIRFIFKKFINEFVLLFSAIINGFKFVFIDIPISFFSIFKRKDNISVSSKTDEITGEKYIDFSYDNYQNRDLLQKMSDFIIAKYESIPSVKAKKEKREASLVPLVLNPNGEDHQKSPIKVTYKYVARKPDGKVVTGYFPAFSKMDVYSYLTDEKMIVYEITTNKTINFLHAQSNIFKTKMKNRDLIFWLAQLSTYIKAGIPLTDSVKVLASQDRRKKYRTLYSSLIYELTMGQPFSEALARQGNAFPSLLVNMIKSSEMAGNIESTLDEMSDYYQEIEDTRKAIFSALAYPSIILVFAIGVVAFMLTYIVPKFVEIYNSMDAQINSITQMCLNLSSFLKNNYLYIILAILILIVVFTYLYKKVKAFRMSMQRLFMHFPVIGKLIISKEMNLFSRTFASLQKNNVLLTDSIGVLSKITNNEVYRDIMLRTINNLIKGNKMSESFRNHWAIPQIAYFMIVTGESTGELASMLDKVADYYQKEQRQMVGTIKTFVEPVMIVSLAVVVGFILVSILIPMFDIYRTVA